LCLKQNVMIMNCGLNKSLYDVGKLNWYCESLEIFCMLKNITMVRAWTFYSYFIEITTVYFVHLPHYLYDKNYCVINGFSFKIWYEIYKFWIGSIYQAIIVSHCCHCVLTEKRDLEKCSNEMTSTDTAYVLW
jgi:hypothetical protein